MLYSLQPSPTNTRFVYWSNYQDGWLALLLWFQYLEMLIRSWTCLSKPTEHFPGQDFSLTLHPPGIISDSGFNLELNFISFPWVCFLAKQHFLNIFSWLRFFLFNFSSFWKTKLLIHFPSSLQNLIICCRKQSFHCHYFCRTTFRFHVLLSYTGFTLKIAN